VRSDLQQRDQDEGTRVQERMRQYQASTLSPRRRPAEAPAPDIEDIDVEWSRYCPHGRRGLAPCAPLNLLDKPEQSRWSEAGLGHDDGVEVGGLASAAHRLGPIEV
jgi:hypothetical protein